jgi:hypothetical protein
LPAIVHSGKHVHNDGTSLAEIQAPCDPIVTNTALPTVRSAHTFVVAVSIA